MENSIIFSSCKEPSKSLYNANNANNANNDNNANNANNADE